MTKFSKAFVASLCLHGMLLGIYLAFSAYQPALGLSSPTIQVTLAKLGKPRDEKLLPRFDASEAPQSKATSKAPTAPKKVSIKKPQNPLDILKKRFGKASDEGKEHGNALGSSLTSELANSYEAQVLELLRSNYEIPRVISDREAKYLSLWIKLWIGRKGELLKISIQKASKNIRFDQAVLVGSRKIPSFGAPPLQLARKYRTEGLLIQFCPLECL